MYARAYGRSPPAHLGRHISPGIHHHSRFSRTHQGKHSRSYDHLPSLPPRHYEMPRYRQPYDSPHRGGGLQLSHLHSREHSTEALRWTTPKIRVPVMFPTSHKSDLAQEFPHLRTKTDDLPMFKQFHYPSKIPPTPDKIHKGSTQRSKVNSTINDNEMRPSYQSHKRTSLFTPELLNETEEEVLYRAEEEFSDMSEPLSLEDNSYLSVSEEASDVYQYNIQEEQYESRRSSRPMSRNSSLASVHLEKEEEQPRRSERKARRKEKATSERLLTPLREERDEGKSRKKVQKAQAPLSFPKPKKRPAAHSPTRYVPQPILYPMPQPYPMPVPMLSPYYYPPQMLPPPSSVPPANSTVFRPAKREISTQAGHYLPECVQTEPPAEPRVSNAFFDALAEMDRRLGLGEQVSVTEEGKAVKKPVALEIGLAEGKSLAEHFQEKLPQVSANIESRNQSRSRPTHKEKSTAELLEIRRDLLRPFSGNMRLSNASGSSDPRQDSPSMRSIDPRQLEKADRLAAGMSVVLPKKPSSERLFSGSETPLSCITEETSDRRGRKRAPVKIQ